MVYDNKRSEPQHMYLFAKTWNPDIYQGRYKRKNYFEGWYIKLIDKSSNNVFAIIPGISKSQSDSHAFIQVINGTTDEVYYYNFSSSLFHYSKKDFAISIGNNLFSKDKLILNLPSLKGKLSFNNIISFPKTLTRPGIMGPFSFLPFMECYHGIVNIRHEISGKLSNYNGSIDFDKGSGYIEKDWGSSFPKSWIWLQSNNIESRSSAFMFSIARIPCFGTSFIGLLCFLWIDEKMYFYATYTGAKIKLLNCDEDSKLIKIIVSDSKTTLNISAVQASAGQPSKEIIKAPVMGHMSRNISESLSAIINLELKDKSNKLLYSGSASKAGMEIAGDINLLLKKEYKKDEIKQGEYENVILDKID